jgi:hypothetical protein
MTWTRSTFCSESACIEVAAVDGTVMVRDGKRADGPHLSFSIAEWQAFCAGISHGDFRFDE